MNKENPLLTVICLAYNHQKYLARALDGFIIQKTSFSMEVIVHDDCSTDDTAAIMREYEKKYPNLFSNIYQTENLFSKGKGGVGKIVFRAARGKYIALCEGDDYWTDPLKLEKQVEFLEGHEEYAMAFHRVEQIAEGKETVLSDFPGSEEGSAFTILDLARGNFIHTPSVVFRNIFPEGLPDWFAGSPVGDYLIYMLSAEKGKIKYFPEPMAVYRRHVGMWSAQSELLIWQKWIIVLDLLMEHLPNGPVIEVLKEQKSLTLSNIYARANSLELDYNEVLNNPAVLAKRIKWRHLVKAIGIKMRDKFT